MTDQVFIYFRPTTRGVEMFASRDLSRRMRTAGTTKTHYSRVSMITDRDPLADRVRTIMDGMLRCARPNRVPNQRVSIEDLTRFLEPVATVAKIDATLLPAEGILPRRIAVRG